jgi:hypothetical protein
MNNKLKKIYGQLNNDTQSCPDPKLGNIVNVSLYGRGDFVDMIKNLEMGDYSSGS